jgi:hypothetical protein
VGNLLVAIDLAALLVFLVLLGAARCYLAFRENRSLAHLYRRLHEMEHKQAMKKLELATARQELGLGKTAMVWQTLKNHGG